MNATPPAPQSPFDPSPDETREAPSHPASPFAHDPQPRPGIIHLLVWTACTAVFLGVQQLLLDRMTMLMDSVAYSIQRIGYGLGAGVAIGSLGMLVVRRRRGIKFPIHPGEYLLVLHGVSIVVTFIAWWVSLTAREDVNSWPGMVAILLPYVSVTMIAALWAAKCTRLLHWRIFFVAFALLIVLEQGFSLVLPTFFWMSAWMRYPLQLAIPSLLAFAIWRDRATKNRRPWTHWIGVGLELWLWFTERILPLLFAWA